MGRPFFVLANYCDLLDNQFRSHVGVTRYVTDDLVGTGVKSDSARVDGTFLGYYQFVVGDLHVVLRQDECVANRILVGVSDDYFAGLDGAIFSCVEPETRDGLDDHCSCGECLGGGACAATTGTQESDCDEKGECTLHETEFTALGTDKGRLGHT